MESRNAFALQINDNTQCSLCSMQLEKAEQDTKNQNVKVLATLEGVM